VIRRSVHVVAVTDSLPCTFSSCSNAPWTRYDDHRISRASWKTIREDTRASLADTGYVFFYRKLNARERVKMAKSRGQQPDPADVKEAGTEAIAAAEVKSEVKLVRSVSLTHSPALGNLSEADSPFVLSPALPELCTQDNVAFLKELSGGHSAHYLQALNAATRRDAQFIHPFHVALAAPAAAASDKKTEAKAAGAAGGGASTTGEGQSRSAMAEVYTDSDKDPLCATCLLPQRLHSIVSPLAPVAGSSAGDAKSSSAASECPLAGSVVGECPHCLMRVSARTFASHVAHKQCAAELWPGFEKPLPPAVDAAAAAGAATGPAPVAEGQVVQGPENQPPLMERRESGFPCERCNQLLPNWDDYMAHYATCGDVM
jgi:hypothetical protein